MSTPPPTLLALVGANPEPLVAHLLDWAARTAAPLHSSASGGSDTPPEPLPSFDDHRLPAQAKPPAAVLHHVVLCVPLAWAELTQNALMAAGCLADTAAIVNVGAAGPGALPPVAQPLPHGSRLLQEGLHRTVHGSWSITWLVGEPSARLPQAVCHASEVWLADEHVAVDGLAKPIARLCVRGAQLVGQRASAQRTPSAWQAWEQAGFVPVAPPAEPHASATVQPLLAHYAPRWPVPIPLNLAQAEPMHAVVIGAGLAGAALCASLTRRGWQVDLLDQHCGPAQGASALPVGMLSEHVTAHETLLSELSRVGMAWHWAQLQALVPVGAGWQPCQVANLRDTGPERSAPLTLPAALVRPAALVQAWLAQAQATGLLRTHWQAKVARLQPVKHASPASGHAHPPEGKDRHPPADADGPAPPLQWQVLDECGNLLALAPHVVVASAYGSAALLSPWVSPTADGDAAAHPPRDSHAALPLRPVKGQMSYGPLSGEPHAPHPLRDHGVYVPCYEDRLHPSAPRLWAMGSTYTRGVNDSTVCAQDHSRNAESLKAMLPQAHSLMAEQQAQGTLMGWAQVRCASQDRLPLAGAVPAPETPKPNAQLPTLARWPGLWTLTALGSRGLTLSMVGAELVVARMLGEPWPLTRHQADALDPARFALKAARASHAAQQTGRQTTPQMPHQAADKGAPTT